MLHRLLGIGGFYASTLKENPPAPENKSINFKKVYICKRSPRQGGLPITKSNEVIATILCNHFFSFPALLETTINTAIAIMTRKRDVKKAITSVI